MEGIPGPPEPTLVPQRVQVAVRLRPPGLGSSGNTAPILVEPQNCIKVEVAPMHSFTFDAVLGVDATQESLYAQLVSPLVDIFISGINATIFAYGQTGSGKTYTMGTGLESVIFSTAEMGLTEQGIVPRAIIEIFGKLSPSLTSSSSSIFASFIEIYNEKAKDLLVGSSITPSTPLVIREDSRGDIYLAGCHEEQVSMPADLFKVVKRGTLARTTGATDMNASSSRSHAILSLILRQQIENGEARVSRFHFVDLAGSERLKRTNAQGARAKEAISINGGLLALGNVISALSAGRNEHIPYRDSKLTRLLQNALGGNSCTLMIACISPDEASLSESVNTLKYAARAKNIRNNAHVNMDMSCSAFEVAQLKKQVMNLKKENFELRALVRKPLPQGGDSDTLQGAVHTSPTVLEENIAALRASYEAKLIFLQEQISNLKKDSSGAGSTILAESRIGIGLSKTLREKYETKIRELSRELASAKLATARTSTTSSSASAIKASQEVQLLSHQLTTLRSTLQSTRVEKNRTHQQLTEEMTRLRVAFEQREAELRQLRIVEREHKEELNRLRRSLEHAKSIIRKKSSTTASAGSSLCGGSLTRSISYPSTSKGHSRGLWSPRGKDFLRESQPLLPMLSPETLHKRSAFIIAPSSPAISVKKPNFLEQELKIEHEEGIPMDFSKEIIAFSKEAEDEETAENKELNIEAGNLSANDFERVEPPSPFLHHHIQQPVQIERSEPVSVSSLFSRISAFATSSRNS
ncbi:hypothetical protein DI09_113p30 [Mitosporidium daphniae]|uniref:Kinesin-like protein n=1 Tax=Mitosporidium daphniae TaxID=1485682 RepID=A0A098VVT3_9MICR|nr:uncharacterized protein DI09_113p30 [Mitosporidium daphniae]KGG53062.1 hypothetical protein DI09_113p30 [Mitosporidium daphniae]|eukprot:XP_013239498.1 uncharacterized protein DI09_113p30 [Mitosporidium daphniae]